jgi:Rrf2 family transcriptional regulator, cysteine metabolism repressor
MVGVICYTFCMLQISKRIQYGLYFLIALSCEKENKPISLTKISDQISLPYRFLSQIAGSLKAAKIIDSREGIKGGYFLIKNPREISLLDLVETLDGTLSLIDCQNRKICKDSDNCRLKKVWDKAKGEVETVLRNYNLADFAN